jgi:hypothetical protein
MKMTLSKTATKKRVSVFSIGSMALGHLLCSKKWQVIATFKRSLYCRDNKANIICIGKAEIGNGPFTILCSSGSPWPEQALSGTRQIRVLKNQLLIEGTGITFDLHGALVWNKGLRTISEPGDYFLTDIRWIAEKALRDAPRESLGRVVASFSPLKMQQNRRTPDILSDLLHKNFVEVISEIRNLSILLPGGEYNTSLAEGLGRLIGLGPGLTPSGDDFLSGVVMGLFKTGREDEAAWLAHYLYRAAQGRVTDIGLAFYRALSQGQVTEPYLLFLNAIGTGDILSLERLLTRVSLLGATSGWDSITGMLFGFRLSLSKQSQKQNQILEAVC